MLSKLRIKKIKKITKICFNLRLHTFPLYDFWPRELKCIYSNGVWALLCCGLKEEVRYAIQWSILNDIIGYLKG